MATPLTLLTQEMEKRRLWSNEKELKNIRTLELKIWKILGVVPDGNINIWI